MPYTVSCSPAPLTFTIRTKLGWRVLLSIAWVSLVGYSIYDHDWGKIDHFDIALDVGFLLAFSLGVLASFIRRERIEIYPDQIVWSRTYFGITSSSAAQLQDVLAIEWNEGEKRGRYGKGPDYVEFYLPAGSIKACFGFSYDEFDKMRQDIATMFPYLVKRWGTSTARSKELTLLNLS